MLAALLLAVPASATSGNLNTYITGLTPAQNAVINIGGSPTFQVVVTCKGMGLQAYISRSETVDGDGAFLAGDVQDQFPMPETSFSSGTYEGTPQGTWLQQAGQYYWQVRTVAQCEGDASIPWASQPVFIQVIGQTTTSGTTDVTQQENGDLLTIAQARAAIAPAVAEGQAQVGARPEAHVHAAQLGQHPRGGLLRVMDGQQEVPLQRPVARWR